MNRNNLREAFAEVPPIEEQREIVHRADFLLIELADTIEKKVTSAKSRADKLMQAILVHRIENITSNAGKIASPYISIISYKIVDNICH